MSSSLIKTMGRAVQGCDRKRNIDVGGDAISSPHDPSVRYSKKNKNTEWRGYKAQVTEHRTRFPRINRLATWGEIQMLVPRQIKSAFVLSPGAYIMFRLIINS